ncbi:hypothetical protein Y1Q_0019388 [Alligator mississippiensis]|uniref:Uncharacterized protein n=1 Tax=Alligator mississippiensis TaxID=8496 RepID=A0A151MRE9_ALLMI|nr:hypothetical protein Y1Q_0019388 [Alligator mississippiensis]
MVALLLLQPQEAPRTLGSETAQSAWKTSGIHGSASGLLSTTKQSEEDSLSWTCVLLCRYEGRRLYNTI